MNRIICFLTLAFTIAGPMPIQAKTPKWFKGTGNSVVEVTTFRDGVENGHSLGFFIDQDGSCVSDYTVFVGADSAITKSRDGIVRPVRLISGASNMYETVLFTVKPDKKLKPIVTTLVKAQEKGTVFIVPFQGNGKSLPVQSEIKEVSVIDGGSCYYKLDTPYNPEFIGCPAVDEDGNCIGIIQAGKENDRYTYVLDVNYTKGISPNATDLLDRCYTDIKIRHRLPSDEDQALAYIFIHNGISTEEYRNLLIQFMEEFPDSPDGVFNYGAFLISEHDGENSSTQGEDYIRKAIEMSDDKARFYCDYASLLVENLKISGSSDDETKAVMEKALAEVDKAIGIKNDPAYIRLKSNILYSMKRYHDAYDCAEAINRTDAASAETYLFAYEISRKLDNLELSIELLDSVISKSPVPISQKVVALYLERGNLKDDAGMYRDAVKDYIAFEQATVGTLPARFYLAKEQIEVKARMYEPALADISKAIELDPDNNDYILEKASLHLRVGQAEQALEIMEKLVVIMPDDPDVQRLTGISYLRCNDKENACEHLSQARILGDELVESIIEQSCR